MFVEVQIHITKPTWSNHHNIFKDAGVDKKEYSYYKPSTKGLDFEGLVSDLKVYHFLITALAVAHKHVGIHMRSPSRPSILLGCQWATITVYEQKFREKS